MKLTQAQLCNIELLVCKDWDDFQWILTVARINRKYNFNGVIV